MTRSAQGSRTEARRLERATAVMAAGTALSRITGVARIFALAYALGFTRVSDAYNLANTMPNIVHDLVIGGVLAATFVPVFVERMASRPEHEAREAISTVVTVTLVALAVACIAFLLAAPFLVDATTFLIHGAQARLERSVATDLLRLFVPQLAAYGFVSLATALLNATRRFGPPAFAPVANNLVLIGLFLSLGTVYRHPTLAGVHAHEGELLLLGIGTTLGVVIQALLLVPSLRETGLGLRWHFSLRHEAVRTVLRLSGWTFGFVAANQAALMVVLALSEHAGPGDLTSYTYAYTIFQLPFGVVAISVMSAVAPELAHHWTTGSLERFRRRLRSGFRSVMAVVVPAAAGEVVLARPMVALFFGHGASSYASTSASAGALAMLGLGLPGFCAFLYAVRVLQSVQDTRGAFWLYLLENGLNVAGALLLAGPFGLKGITLSISIAYTLASFVAFSYLEARFGPLSLSDDWRTFGRTVVATAFLVLGAAMASSVIASHSSVAVVARVGLGVLGGAGGYILVAAVGTWFGAHSLHRRQRKREAT